MCWACRKRDRLTRANAGEIFSSCDRGAQDKGAILQATGRRRDFFSVRWLIMSDEFDVFEESGQVPVAGPVAMPRIPEEPMPPVSNRFLFVDIAAQRAKQ